MEEEYYVIKIPKNILDDTIEFWDSGGYSSTVYTVEELAEIIIEYINDYEEED